MCACYDDSITFQDPAFGTLKGREVCTMWEMLLNKKESELEIQFYDIRADETGGSASWSARYRFGPAKRRVKNRVNSEFKFEDGKIIDQKDHFDLWAWSRQALGLTGYLLGWSSFLKYKIQGKSKAALLRFTKKIKR